MALARGNTASGRQASGTSLTYSHTVATGNNRVLVVGVDTIGTSDLVTSVTYAGIPMTRATTGTNSSSRRTYMYTLISPPMGANNVVVSTSGSTAIIGISADYNGAEQVQPDSFISPSGSNSTSYAMNFTTVANNSWTVAIVATDAGGSAPTASTGSTQIQTVTGDGGVKLFDSNAAITPAGAYTMNYTSGVSTIWIGSGVSIKPYTTGIALGATTSSSNTGSSSLTFAGPSVSGSDTILWVAQYLYRFTSVNAPTYNGVAMTLAGNSLSVQSNRFLGLYYVVNPTSGANVVISGTGTDGTRGIRGSATYYTGASQTGIPDATADALAAPGTSVNDSVTTVADNAWIVGAAAGPGNAAKVASTGVNTRASSGTADGFNYGDSNGPKTPAGSYSMTFTCSASDDLGLVMASFAPAVAPAASSIPDMRLAFI